MKQNTHVREGTPACQECYHYGFEDGRATTATELGGRWLFYFGLVVGVLFGAMAMGILVAWVGAV